MKNLWFICFRYIIAIQVKKIRYRFVILYSGGEIMESWEKVKAVQRMQVYIEEHLTESITLKMLAKAAGYSPWHAERIFKELIHKNPFNYIRALRLSRAAVKLRDEKIRVIDVALDFVFDSHEGF